ncbi:MAG: hypothetical protein IPN22_00415 [Bacteroidetes bacterium]|nr:hypothetical protein [Bacteroidota bacterium]
MEITFTLVQKRITPLNQTFFALLVGLLGMLTCRFFHLPTASEYFAAHIAIIFFCLLNIVVSLAHSSFLRYTMPSFYLFIVLVAVLLLLAKFFSGISIWTLNEYRMMLIPIGIFYFMASLFSRGIRFIYEAAERGDF